MPAKVLKQKSPAGRKPEAAAEGGIATRPKAPAVQREYASLRLFLTQGGGFRLALATFDRPAERDGLTSRLVEDLGKFQVLLSILDIAKGEGSLLERVEKHLAEQPTPKGYSRAIAVVNVEARLTHSDVRIHEGD